MKTALIIGITGQDGAYLARLLLNKGYYVHGSLRRTSLPNTWRLKQLNLLNHERLHLHYGDVTDTGCLFQLLNTIRPAEVYNLAAQSDVAVSFELPDYTTNTNTIGTIRLLEALRILKLTQTRYYQASTSEIYGRTTTLPQNEATPFMPCSPYGVAKLAAYWTTVNYRDAYGIHACNGILFNHESPLRGEMFISRKVTSAVAAIRAGKQEVLMVGNLDARRDWGHAADFVEGIWRMLQHSVPGDYVLATGECHSVREFITLAFSNVGIMLEWKNSEVEETGCDARTGKTHVRVNPQFFRPYDVPLLQGDAGKAHRDLGWHHSINFTALVEEMVQADMAALN